MPVTQLNRTITSAVEINIYFNQSNTRLQKNFLSSSFSFNTVKPLYNDLEGTENCGHCMEVITLSRVILSCFEI